MFKDLENEIMYTSWQQDTTEYDQANLKKRIERTFKKLNV